MKITKYSNFIKKEFEQLKIQYNMEWINEGEYGMTLENRYIKIDFFTERGEANLFTYG